MKKKDILLFAIMFVAIFGIISVDAKEINMLDTAFNCNSSAFLNLYKELQSLFRYIKYAAPIILLVMTTLDFSKVVFSDSKDGMDKAKKNFTKRAIMAVVIFFIPDLVNLVFTFVASDEARQCIKGFK